MFHLTFVRINVMRIGSLKLCVVSKCVEFLMAKRTLVTGYNQGVIIKV
jgi:hypothetical protein